MSLSSEIMWTRKKRKGGHTERSVAYKLFLKIAYLLNILSTVVVKGTPTTSNTAKNHGIKNLPESLNWV